jgi:ribosomal protein L37E
MAALLNNRAALIGMKNPLNVAPCTCNQCGSCLSAAAETCPDCGYPQAPGIQARVPASRIDLAPDLLADYRFLKYGGLGLVALGFIAAYADSRFAAGVTLTIGGALYVAGLLGGWWNRRD